MGLEFLEEDNTGTPRAILNFAMQSANRGASPQSAMQGGMGGGMSASSSSGGM